MTERYNLTLTAIFSYFCLCFNASASISTTTSQTEQEKARRDELVPQQQDYRPAERQHLNTQITFPIEKNCKTITKVIIDSEDKKLTDKLLGRLTDAAKSKCLGINGIKLFAQKLQNELIVQGYVTSLISIPSQSLEEGVLHFTLTYGRIGHIAWASGKEDKTQLWNSLPATEGDILRLPDLEQGMANLQRIPGSAAHMQILPGQQNGESTIKLTRRTVKPWQAGVWLNDAGSRSTGRYQGGAALYLYDLSTLNDIFYIAAGRDMEFGHHEKGNNNTSLYYSVPFGYWNLDLYATHSRYHQPFVGQWSTTDYKSRNQYYSATLSRLLSHTREQKTTADLRVFKSTSRYYFGGEELNVMRKSTPGWEITLRHQHYFKQKVVDLSLGLQNRLGWISSTPTPEEKAGLYDKYARIIHADIQSFMKFDLTGDKFIYAPHISAQFSPDRLSSDNMFNIGSRWSVRGFDGERTLSSSQGWFWRNDFIWNTPLPEQQFYLGVDAGKIIGSDRSQSGKVLSGAAIGLRGNLLNTQYDTFVGTPVSKPDSFHTDSLNLGFSLQRRF